MKIVDINEGNLESIQSLSVKAIQKSFIESPIECLEEAKICKAFVPVGLEEKGKLVGFAMYGLFKGNNEERVWMDRLLIDEKYQGRGYGKLAVELLINHLIEEFQCKKIYLSVYADNVIAINLYKRFKFNFNGELDINGERVMVKEV